MKGKRKNTDLGFLLRPAVQLCHYVSYFGKKTFSVVAPSLAGGRVVEHGRVCDVRRRARPQTGLEASSLGEFCWWHQKQPHETNEARINRISALRVFRCQSIPAVKGEGQEELM